MNNATHEVRRNRLLLTLLAVCLALAALLQLNGRSVLSLGGEQGKSAAFAALVQADRLALAGIRTPAAGPIGQLLDSAGRTFGDPSARVIAVGPASGTAASSSTIPEIGAIDTPSVVPAASGTPPPGRGPGPIPASDGLLSQLSPISGPSGFVPGTTPTPQPPTAEPTATPDGPTVLPTPEPSATAPVIPTPTPTVPVIDPVGPISPVPEPAAWALWLLGFGVVGGLVRWRRRALDAAAKKDVGGDAA